MSDIDGNQVRGGTGIGDIPKLVDIGGGTPGLPAVDGSLLTGVSAAALPTVHLPNLIQDNLASPPTIAGTAAVVNGSASVTGTATLFTTVLCVGMIIRFASQPTVSYTIATITAATTLTLTTNYTGTTNAATTIMAPREDDAYIVGSTPAGAWASFAQGDMVVWTGSTPRRGLTAGTWLLVTSGSGGNPANGSSAIITAFQGTAAGSFASQGNKIARYVTGTGWVFTTPGAGQMALIRAAQMMSAFGVYELGTATWRFTDNRVREIVVGGAAITITNTTDVVVAGSIRFIPSAGTYEVVFETSVGNSNNGASVTTSVYVGNGTNANGSIVLGSDKLVITGSNDRGELASRGNAVPTGVQSINAQWKVSANTGSMLQRVIRLKRVA